MDILNKLGIKDINFGGCSGPGNWTKGKNDGLTESFNPSNGQLIASVYNCSKEEYDKLVTEMPKAIDWKTFDNYEKEDNTKASQELACTGEVCEVVDI